MRIAMVHDSGLTKGREARMRRRFPDADLVLFGHSHQPLFERGQEVALLNPGSPTWKRRALGADGRAAGGRGREVRRDAQVAVTGRR